MSGCLELKERTCLLAPEEKNTLVVWLEPAPAKAVVYLDGKKIESRNGRIGAGLTVAFSPEGKSGTVEIRDASGTRMYAFRLVRAQSCPELERAEQEFGKAGVERARVLPYGTKPECRARAHSVAARSLLFAGKNSEAAGEFERAVRLHRLAGEPLQAANDLLTLAWVYTFKVPAYERARGILAEVEKSLGEYPMLEAAWHYYRGQLERETGRLRAAVADFTAAMEWAERLRQVKIELAAAQALADCRQLLGRPADAWNTLDGLLRKRRRDLTPCQLADLNTNMGWLLLNWDGAREEPEPFFRSALELYRGDCKSPDDEANVLTNLALAEMRRGNPERSRELLEKARRVQPRPG
ncbi:MAG: hypothetical protein D6806_17540, partial [Deltaproteobacteria bacterium]